jgi:hypothetical protein
MFFIYRHRMKRVAENFARDRVSRRRK